MDLIYATTEKKNKSIKYARSPEWFEVSNTFKIKRLLLVNSVIQIKTFEDILKLKD